MSGKSSGKEKLIDEEEEVLQAVILADSFNKRFRPLTTKKPRCLLPICNAPLLDWTFESLALAGVQEVFVVCRSHAELVKKAIRESKWSKPGSGMKIVPIMTAKETFSPGDAMRDIYTRGLVTTDFVLVMGDLVSNIRIDEVVRVHKERRKTNKDAIMTMVVKESGVRHRTRARGESAVFVLDPETSECLHYEHLQGYPAKKGINIPREILAAHSELDIRNDLLDCSIDVCSVEVPSLFQDNFDYLDIRRDFVHGILTSDILMKNIYCYVAGEGYAARVQDTRSYDAISKDILSRWTFPLVPDDNHPGGHIYEHTRGNRYIAKDNTVVLSRTCNIGPNTLIGSHTSVSDNSTILTSVLGQRCSVGASTTITSAYLFDGVVVGANCVIEHSIIGAGVHIKDGSRVPRGCLIGDGVVVGPDARLEEFERLSAPRRGKGKDLEVAVPVSAPVPVSVQAREKVVEKAKGEVPVPAVKKAKKEKKAAEGSEDEDEDQTETETETENDNNGDNEEEEEEDNVDLDEDEDSDIEEVEAQQDSLDRSGLGKDSNAIIWPKTPPDEDDEVEGPENWENQRFMRIGEDESSLDQIGHEDDDSSSSDDDDESQSSGDEASDANFGYGDTTDRESLHSDSGMGLLNASSASGGAATDSGLMADAEFRTEVNQSLERAFAENHSVENASVELKTLRMASNVPLRRVKEAVVGAIVEKIVIVDAGEVGGAVRQRKEIAGVVDRWGELINRIGGVDPVETVSILQEHSATSLRMSLFGQILAALYQCDIVEEEHIRAWHKLTGSKGDELKEGVEKDNFKKCWMIGSHMIKQFDAQDSESESESGSDGSDDDDEDDNEKGGDEVEKTPKAPPPPAAAAALGGKPGGDVLVHSSSSSENVHDDEEETATDSTEGVDGGESESASEDVMSTSENSSAAPSATASEDETSESESEA